ncbi:MAG TPA: acyltransferase [Vicinamibacterales bacterium]|nr:acyltransferase [Vicinamibacterales bacterium]
MRRINFQNLDALRGLLAVYVAIGHCRWLLWAGHSEWLAAPHQPWEAIPAYASAAFRYGREAVMVFFVLSGFFIHYQAARIDRRPGTATAFYRRRWHRLAPPYYVALAVTLILDAIGRTWWPVLYQARTGDALLDETFARGGYTTASVAPAFVLLPSSLGRDFGSNGPLWSLAYEAVYYAAYPLWLRLRQRSALAAFAGVPLLCAAVPLLPLGGFAVSVAFHYPIWLAGALIAERSVKTGTSSRQPWIGGLMFVAGTLLHLSAAGRVWPSLVAALLFGCGAVLLFAAASFPARLVGAAEYLGLRSYTIYIVHFPVLALASAWVIQSHGGRPLHGWLALAGAVACVAFGCLCFEICERHFLHPRYRDDSAAP